MVGAREEWLPGDNIHEISYSFIPSDMPIGDYELQVGIVDHLSQRPQVKLDIKRRDTEGWFSISKIEVRD